MMILDRLWISNQKSGFILGYTFHDCGICRKQICNATRKRKSSRFLPEVKRNFFLVNWIYNLHHCSLTRKIAARILKPKSINTHRNNRATSPSVLDWNVLKMVSCIWHQIQTKLWLRWICLPEYCQAEWLPRCFHQFALNCRCDLV